MSWQLDRLTELCPTISDVIYVDFILLFGELEICTLFLCSECMDPDNVLSQ